MDIGDLMIRIIIVWITWMLVLGTSSIWAADNATLLEVQAYGNFHAGGIIDEISGDDDRNSAASLEWRKQGKTAFRPSLDLTRVDDGHFAGSRRTVRRSRRFYYGIWSDCLPVGFEQTPIEK
jgi:hypothetical protein